MTTKIDLPFYTHEDIAQMSDESLSELIALCQHGERVCFTVRNGRMMRRYSFILENLCYPEQDRRRKAQRHQR